MKQLLAGAVFLILQIGFPCLAFSSDLPPLPVAQVSAPGVVGSPTITTWAGGITNDVTAEVLARSAIGVPSMPEDLASRPSGSLRKSVAASDPVTFRIEFMDELTGEPYSVVEMKGIRDSGFMKTEIIKGE